jgi:hypothetical protein
LNKLAYCSLLLGLSFGCLPKDTRPPPSRVLFTASPGATAQADAPATETADGWSITFDRVLVSIGRVGLDGDGCSVYSDPDYGRVLSLLGAPSRQKISEAYALGSCDFEFAIGNASSDSLLGVGTTTDDFDLMRTAGTDRYNSARGISLLVSGRAKKAQQDLTFAWPFRGRARYAECENTVDGVVQRGLSLAQDGDTTVDVALHPEALFAEDVASYDSALRFDAIASADALGNGDGEVSLEELSLVTLSDLQTGGQYSEGEAPVIPWISLEDFVYLGTAPQVARFQETGKCNLRLGDRRGP